MKEKINMVNMVNANLFINMVKTGDEVLVELARRDNEEGTAPSWHRAQLVKVYVQRRTTPYKTGGRYGVVEPKGHLLIFTLENDVWVEYGMRDWSPDFATFDFDNWRMHILEWNEKKIDNPYII